jgi:hypothetical protein
MRSEKIERTELNRLQLLEEFHVAPNDTWFGQTMVAAIRACSLATVERDRWAGIGVPFVKCGRSVRYRKIDILNWLAKHVSAQSTTEHQQKGGK